MFHQNVVPPEFLFLPKAQRVPPWQELAKATIDLIAAPEVSPRLYPAGENPMSRLMSLGYEISFEQYIWESSTGLCMEALARQRTGNPMTMQQLKEGVDFVPTNVTKLNVRVSESPALAA